MLNALRRTRWQTAGAIIAGLMLFGPGIAVAQEVVRIALPISPQSLLEQISEGRP